MFQDMGFVDPAALAAMAKSSESQIAQGLNDGRYRGWLAETSSGEVLAGGGVIITLWPTHPTNLQPRRAEIVNLYTERLHRRRGLAQQLMHAMIDWCRHEGFAWVSLHASEDGRHLYDALGFRPTNEMRLLLD